MPPKILDTHIHLWPSTSLTPTDHAWMTSPTHPLAKRHGPKDYLHTTSNSPHPPSSFIYVETDRFLPTPSPPSLDAEALREWAHQPLEEVRFLRRIVEGAAGESDGVSVSVGEEQEKEKEMSMVKGVVIWAPFHLPSAAFQTYLRIAQEEAGPELWRKVVGFRYLLQGKGEGEVSRLVRSEEWIGNLVALREGLSGRGWSFDVGIDVHRDGWEVLSEVGGMIERVRKEERERGDGKGSVRFVLSEFPCCLNGVGRRELILGIDHLCKHPLTPPSDSNAQPTPLSEVYVKALSPLAGDKNIYMKLSGALNEFTSTTPDSTDVIVATLKPFAQFIFSTFPRRVMFGSDWPVCNVGGPKGEDGNWSFWRDVVEGLLKEEGFEEEDKEWVWWRAGGEAYGLEK